MARRYIDKSVLVREIEKQRNAYISEPSKYRVLSRILSFIDTLEVKEVNIASMADDYYDALVKEAADWMDEGTIGHCRLAYYTGCKDVLAKLQKGELYDRERKRK